MAKAKKTEKRDAAKIELAKLRIQEQEIIEDAGPLGDETTATTMEDVELMFVGKLAYMAMQQSVARGNQLKGYTRAYGKIYPDVENRLNKITSDMEAEFVSSRKMLEKIIKKHPLVLKLCGIKGFTPYRLAIMMSMIKDIGKFDTPSNLAVYAGVGCKEGLKVCKRNLAKIRVLTNNPDFGYNTSLQGQLFITAEAMLKSKGYFFNMYQQIKKRLIDRAINSNQCRMLTDEEIKEGKGDTGRYYMEGRNKQTVEMWAHSNAMTRIARTLLHLIYTAWREHAGLSTRIPYPIEYLGHRKIITLESVLKYESDAKKNN